MAPKWFDHWTTWAGLMQACETWLTSRKCGERLLIIDTSKISINFLTAYFGKKFNDYLLDKCLM